VFQDKQGRARFSFVKEDRLSFVSVRQDA